MYWTGLKTYWTLRRNLTLPRETLYQRSWEAFCNLVGYAYQNVLFYRQLYDDAGFRPDQLKSPADLPRVPTTRKKLFQGAELSQLLAKGQDPERLIHRHTSGSSGEPLQVYYTPADRLYRTMLHLRILFHNGMTWRDRMAHLSDRRYAPDFSYSFQNLGFLRKDFISVAEPEAEQLERLAQIHPTVIYSYASNMVQLAAEVESGGRNPIHPKLIFTTGELLPPADRERINRVFSTKLRDIYGLVEMGDVAWQCSHVEGYHVNIDSFMIEIDAGGRPARSGESGKLIITNLHSHVMPFIRYEVGDVMTAPHGRPCSCGCSFPRLDLLQGREDDWLYLPDGKRLSSMVFVVATISGVKQYRIIQKALDYLQVEVVPGSNFTAATLKRVQEHVAGFTGPTMRIEVLRVEAIPKQAGKIRSVIQEVER